MTHLSHEESPPYCCGYLAWLRISSLICNLERTSWPTAHRLLILPGGLAGKCALGKGWEVTSVTATDFDDPREGTNAVISYSVEKNVIDEFSGQPIFDIDSVSGR
ncbi:Neural-cadherin [Portunus trituberculatus]|uniref:Neural-cadherin n=1 Tax=Portunus trituberculatus TaxID=210409 RepID=A0A5B7FZK7_PORTR|nr:Neural-cadherin [Portunus trituberculatus]